MAKRRGTFGWLCALALGVWLAGPGVAGAEILGNLVLSGGTVVSLDGSVEFSGFSYVPTVGAPDAMEIEIAPDASVPQGFLVREAVGGDGTLFSASEGMSVNALLGFDAMALGMGAFTLGELELIDSTVIGDFGATMGSSAFVAEKVDALGPPKNGAVTTLTTVDSTVEMPVLYDAEPLAGFGTQVEALINISLLAVPGDPANEATVNEFSVNFVPEPATGALILGLLTPVLLRRR